MRWYVSRDGETVGPVEEREVVEWFHAGMREGMVRDEAGGPWTPIMQSPFALLKPRAPSAASQPTTAASSSQKKSSGSWTLTAVVVVLLGLVGTITGVASMPPSAQEVARRAAESDAKERAEAHARRVAREADPNFGVVAPAETPGHDEMPSAVDLAKLLSEYKDNEVRADGEYKGRRVAVVGGVRDVKRGIGGDSYLVVGTDKPFEIPALQCFLRDGQERPAANLSKGDRVQLTGLVDGLMMNVLLKDCAIQ